MNCPNCGRESPDHARFCINCGTALESPDATVGCPNCGQDNPAGAQFCSSCGTELAVTCPNCTRRRAGDGLFCKWCDQLVGGPKGIKAASIGRRVAAYLLDILLFFLTLIIGYLVWWLIALRRGQTPGKQLLGIRVLRADGGRSDWGWTFIREFIVKFALFELAIDSVSFGIGSIIDSLWAFWDRDRQALHDKIMKTIVVDDRDFRSGFEATAATVG